MLTLTLDSSPDAPLALTTDDLDTIIAALTEKALRQDADNNPSLSLEIRLETWADNTGVPAPTNV